MNVRLVAVIAAAAVAVSLTACTGGPKAPTPASAGSVELAVQAGPDISPQTLANVNQGFMARHPGVKVRMKDPSMGKTNAATLDGVDAVILPVFMLYRLAQDNLLKDLSATKVPQPNETLAGIWQDLGKVNGKQFGLPIAVEPSTIRAGEQTLDKAGVKLPADWTWQDFEQALSRVKGAGLSATVEVSALLEPVIRAYGGQLYDWDRHAYVFDTPEARQGLAALQRLVKTGAVQTERGPVQFSTGNSPAFFVIQGKMLGGPAMAELPFPKGPKGRPAPASASYAAVVAASQHLDLATTYVAELLNSPAAQLELARGGIRPVTSDAKAMAAWQQAVGDKSARATEVGLQDAYVVPSPDLPHNDELFRGLLPYLNGTASLETTLPSLLSSLNR